MGKRLVALASSVLLLISACSSDVGDETTTSAIAAPTTSTSTSTSQPGTTQPRDTTTTLDAIAALEPGLFCRDLNARGFDYAQAVAYWLREGSPDRMDADRNGIPCETVYPAADVTGYWGQPTGVWATLPLASMADVAYLDAVPESRQAFLARNGFVIDDTDPIPHMGWIYEQVYDYEQHPVFVTTDAAFHHWHLVFDKVLRDTETKELLPALEDLMEQLLAKARSQTKELAATPLAEAAARAEEHLEAVATVLELDVGPIGARATEEVALVEAHTDFRASPTVGGECSLAFRSGCVDYSKMTPRGHYTRSADLTRYFKAMSLLGNTGFGLDQPGPLQVGLLISRLIVSDPAIGDMWETIYQPTAILVGAADDYTPFEAAAAASAVSPGWLGDPAALASDAAMGRVAEELRSLRTVEINPEAASVRTMGVRFILDSYVLDQLADPTVPGRGAVSALDVAAAFGSDWALDRQHEADATTTGPEYAASMQALRTLIGDRTAPDWEDTIYDAWLYSLEPSFLPRNGKAPPFMRTEAWTAKAHQTGLGSYTELKHDTILYGKEGMAEGDIPSPPTILHWVEPDPATFRRIALAAELLRDALAGQGLLPEASGDFYSLSDILAELIEMTNRFADIAQREIEEGRPSPEDSEWLNPLGQRLSLLLERTGDQGAIDPYGGIVADIFLNGFAMEVLELGTGEFDRIHVVVPDGAGGLQVATGAVYSYYEFWQDRSDRLTDEQWWDMIEAGDLPVRPDWVADHLGL